MEAGHGGASGRYDFLREIAFDYAFILTELGREAAPGAGEAVGAGEVMAPVPVPGGGKERR